MYRKRIAMIKVTRLNNSQYIINCELIETIEATPDTVITLTDGKKYIVTESTEEVMKKIIDFRSRVFEKATIIINK